MPLHATSSGVKWREVAKSVYAPPACSMIIRLQHAATGKTGNPTPETADEGTEIGLCFRRDLTTNQWGHLSDIQLPSENA